MAILKPFECTIKVDGVDLPEYDDEDTDQASTTTSQTKYVEASSGANFSVSFTLQTGWAMKADFIAWCIHLDGKYVNAGVISKEAYDRHCNLTDEKFGVKSGGGDDCTIRKYRFADIMITDKPLDLTSEQVKKEFENLGSITIEVWRKRLLQKVDTWHDLPVDIMHKSLGLVPEKALKGQALSLSTDLGPPEKHKRRSSHWIGKKIEQFPVATFQFKYRSHEALKQLLVIPRSPSPLPLEERNPDDLTPAEAQELIHRQKVKLTELNSIKKEGASAKKRDRSSTIGPIHPVKVVRTASGHDCLELDDSSDDAEIVKVESRSARKSKPPAEIEVIDLLD